MKPLSARPGEMVSAVAPRTGAWIETNAIALIPSFRRMSPPARGRGLKLTLA